MARFEEYAHKYQTVALTQYLKGQMHDLLGYGLALEGLAMIDTTSGQV